MELRAVSSLGAGDLGGAAAAAGDAAGDAAGVEAAAGAAAGVVVAAGVVEAAGVVAAAGVVVAAAGGAQAPAGVVVAAGGAQAAAGVVVAAAGGAHVAGKGAAQVVWVAAADACSDEAIRALSEDGVVGIRGCLPGAALLAPHIDELLTQAIAEAEADDEAEVELFGNVLARDKRWDLKLPLDAEVGAALRGLVGCCRGLLEHMATDAARVAELSCLVSDPGASAQSWHPDTPFSKRLGPARERHPDTPYSKLLKPARKRHPDTQLPDAGGMPLFTVFAALQDISAADGPLEVAPGTNTQEEHDRLREGKFATAEVATADVTCGVGDAYVIDSRVWHRGGANVGQRRRVFYASFRAPCSAPPGSTYSLRGILQNSLRLSAL